MIYVVTQYQGCEQGIFIYFFRGFFCWVATWPMGRFREDPRQTGPASPNGATVTFRAAETSGLLFMLLTRYRPQVDGPENGVGLLVGGSRWV